MDDRDPTAVAQAVATEPAVAGEPVAAAAAAPDTFTPLSWAAIAAVVSVSVATLAWMGRGWWCKCGTWWPWSFDIWSLHNSQHLIDPYSFTHVLHGLLFYGGLRLVLGRNRPALRVVIAVALEAAWEVAENTNAVVDAYRESTISLEYFGDSIANSVSDIAACLAGYALAGAIPVWAAAGGFAVTELVLALWIRDGLLLNIVMLVWPIEAIKAWQLGAGS